jgi:hypothetical protein
MDRTTPYIAENSHQCTVRKRVGINELTLHWGPTRDACERFLSERPDLVLTAQRRQELRGAFLQALVQEEPGLAATLLAKGIGPAIEFVEWDEDGMQQPAAFEPHVFRRNNVIDRRLRLLFDYGDYRYAAEATRGTWHGVSGFRRSLRSSVVRPFIVE